jgi:hypothetical protein
MSKSRGFLLTAIALSVAFIAPLSANAAEPAAAKSLLARAQRTAKSKKKAVWVMYHASW